MRVEPKQGAPESMLLLFLFLAVPCGMCPVRFDLPHNNILMRGRRWHPTPVLLPGKSWTEEPGRLQSMGSLELDTTERLHFHFPLSCIGEGNGNPLQCSCLENPRDRGAWWAAVYGVVQSRTRLKQLSSSSSSSMGQQCGHGIVGASARLQTISQGCDLI